MAGRQRVPMAAGLRRLAPGALGWLALAVVALAPAAPSGAADQPELVSDEAPYVGAVSTELAAAKGAQEEAQARSEGLAVPRERLLVLEWRDAEGGEQRAVLYRFRDPETGAVCYLHEQALSCVR